MRPFIVVNTWWIRRQCFLATARWVVRVPIMLSSVGSSGPLLSLSTSALVVKILFLELPSGWLSAVRQAPGIRCPGETI